MGAFPFEIRKKHRDALKYPVHSLQTGEIIRKFLKNYALAHLKFYLSIIETSHNLVFKIC